MSPILPRAKRASRRSRLGREAGRVLPADRRWRRSAIEALEERAMLSIAQQLQDEIQPYQSAISTALDVATSLPLVGTQFKDLQQLDHLLNDSLNTIEAATSGIGSGHANLAIPLPPVSTTFAFNLGLDAFLKVTTSGDVKATISPVLNVGFDYDGTDVTLDTDETNLDIGFGLALPNFQLTGSLNGLLYTHAVDQGTNFNGHLIFGFNSSGGVSPDFSGDAHIRLGLSLSFVDPATNASFNPTFKANLELDWGIDTQTNTMQVPHIALKNFGLDVDSFTHNFLGDIVTTVQKYTKPLQPFIDMFDTPVPILSAFDSSQTIGDLLLKGAALSQDQQDRFNLLIRVVKSVNTLDLSGNTGGAVLSFGDINLTGDARQLNGFNFDTSQISGVVDDIFNNPLFDDLQDTLTSVASYAGLTSTAGFQFPLLDAPGPVIGGILTGQTKTMFSYSTGRVHFELAPSIGVGIKDLIGVFLSAGIVFDANFSMGYDTAGLIKLFQDPAHKPEDLLHGFYFDNSVDTADAPIPNVSAPKMTGLYLQGFAELSASAIVTLSGGLYANMSVELSSNDNSSHVYLDTMVQNLSSPAKVFKFSGEVYASASIELTLDTEIGPKITFFSYELARHEILNYNPPPAPSLDRPLRVIDVTNQHTLLLDPTKMTGGAVKVQAFHDFTITSAGTFVGDGIRVDYPNEIDLFIERKDDATTNYYNLLTVDGVVPDGTTVIVNDPFRMFRDEGAPDPRPTQTTPGVLLVGGRNVGFNYNEASDGTHPTVLLAGGYGSNTLSGGTMEFGNFIPPARLDQAKQHFGDASGFDATGIARINSAIDADVAPADPAGIIGATMTAGHGGLMYGGPGSNSFIAVGPGNYEMIGGPWVDNFSISPSFNGIPATYAIDGGPGGQNNLIVRIPSGEHVSIQGSTLVDKYDPTLKALEVDANAGIAATAHGITSAHLIAQAGSKLQLGDTSELNISFSIEGASDLGFGGSIAPDVFDVSADYNFYGNSKLRFVNQLVAIPYYTFPDLAYGLFSGTVVARPLGRFGAGITNGHYDIINVPPFVVNRLDGPVYSITRTFGTNGKTQTIYYRVSDTAQSSITLDGAGSSDTYNIKQGLGSFLDIHIEDSDTTTQNVVNVNFFAPELLPAAAKLTNDSLQLYYFTPMIQFINIYRDLPNLLDYSTGYHFVTTSAAYTPTVFFGANVDVALHSARPFKHTVVDRPAPAPNQQASISFNAGWLETWTPPYMPGYDVEYGDAGNPIWFHEIGGHNYYEPIIMTMAYDALQPQAGFTSINAQFSYSQNPVATSWQYYINLVGDDSTPIDVYANGGNLSIDRGGSSGTVDIHANTGTLTIHNYHTTVGVVGNTGTINLVDNNPSRGLSTLDSLIYIGSYDSNSYGNLANVHGTINVAGDDKHGTDGIVIDDRVGTPKSWNVSPSRVQIGDLTVNLNTTTLSQFTVLDLHYAAGTHVTLQDQIPFSGTYFNFVQGFPLSWYPPYLWNVDGDTVDVLLDSFATEPVGPVNYAATNLPPGLSLDSNTGEITGTIEHQASVNAPYQTAFTVTSGDYSINTIVPWNVVGAIGVYPAFGALVNIDQGQTVSLGPITVFGPSSLPVTITVTGLPSWLTFDPDTTMITGTAPTGAAANANYHVTINAADGTDVGRATFDISLSTIKFADLTPVRFNRFGDTVNFSVAATTESGRPLSYTGNLPVGLSLSPNGVISGTIAGNNIQAIHSDPTIVATDGITSREIHFVWNILPSSTDDVVRITSPGPQLNAVGDSVYIRPQAESSILATLVVSAQGLPPGFAVRYGYITGTVTPEAIANSPYLVTLTASDGLHTASTSFTWTIVPASSIQVYSPGTITTAVGANVEQPIYTSAPEGSTLLYSATGLPPGLSIDPQTGVITGAATPLAAMPTSFYTTVTVSDGTTSAATKFAWIVDGGNVATLIAPGGGTITLTSSPGTHLRASITDAAAVAGSGAMQFPFGYVNFDITPFAPFNLLPGASATLTISGAGVTELHDFYRYGPTPSDPAPHWYNFLYRQQTDGDSAATTGMEIVGNTIVLHLVDGQRGDDDLIRNSDIHSFAAQAPTAAITGAPATWWTNSVLRLSSSDTLPLSPDIMLKWQVKKDATVIATGSGQSFDFLPTTSGDYTITLNLQDAQGNVLGTQSIQIPVADLNALNSGAGPDAPILSTVSLAKETGLRELTPMVFSQLPGAPRWLYFINENEVVAYSATSGPRIVVTSDSLITKLVNVGNTWLAAIGNGQGLWAITPNGTQQIAAGTSSLVIDPGSLVSVGTALFFTAADIAEGGNWEIYSATVDSSGAIQVVRATHFGNSADPNLYEPVGLAGFAGGLAFAIRAGDVGTQGPAAQLYLLRQDATGINLTLLATDPAETSRYGFTDLTSVGGANDAQLFVLRASDNELLAVDSATLEVTQLHSFAGQILGGGPAGSFQDFVADDFQLLFSVITTDDTGHETQQLWKSDGTVAGTTTLGTPLAREGGNGIYEKAYLNGALYYLYQPPSPATATELWRADPLTGQVNKLAEFASVLPDGSGSRPSGLSLAQGDIYFSANDNAAGRTVLWRLPAGADTPTPLAMNPANGYAYAGPVVAFGGREYFLARSDVLGSMQLFAFTPPASTQLSADANHDGVVNGQDIAAVASHWLQSGLNNPGDVNGDGIVNGLDIALIASHWLQRTDSGASVVAGSVSSRADMSSETGVARIANAPVAWQAATSIESSVYVEHGADNDSESSDTVVALVLPSASFETKAPSFAKPQSPDRTAAFVGHTDSLRYVPGDGARRHNTGVRQSLDAATYLLAREADEPYVPADDMTCPVDDELLTTLAATYRPTGRR